MTTNGKRKKLKELPSLSPQMIEKLLNEHIKGTESIQGCFHCGRMLGYGGSGAVYKLYYEESENEKDTVLAKLNLAVKAVSPLETYVREKRLSQEKPVDDVLSALDFAPFIRGGKRVLESVARCHDQEYFKHHFLHYYPDLSFKIDSVIPYASIVVMDEVAGTLDKLTLPKDIPSIIRMIVKIGKEIGGALQAAEYADDSAGFLHRDIKPANVGIVINLSNPEVYEFVLIDIESGIPTDAISDTTHTIIVNEFARAPELLNNTPGDEIDFAKVDMYHLGELMAYIIKKENIQLLPEGLQRIIRIASHKDPSHRYDDGDELIEDLEKFEKEYSQEAVGESENLRVYMDEQNELLAEEKRNRKAERNEFNEKLRKQREEIKSLKKDKADLKTKVAEWKNNFDKEVENEENLKKEAEEAASQANEEIGRLKNENQKLNESVSESGKKCRKLETALNDKEKEIKNIKSESSSRSSELRKENQSLRASLTAAQNEAERYKNENERLKSRHGTPADFSDRISCITEKKNGMVFAVTYRFYDDGGRLIREECPESADEYTAEYVYKKDGTMTKTTYRNHSISEAEILGEDGMPLEHSFYRRGRKSSTRHYAYTYTRKGKVSSVSIDDVLAEKHKYEFYYNGVIREHIVEVPFGNTTNNTIEKYNEHGLIQTSISYTDDQNEEDSAYTKTTYTYRGNKPVTITLEDENHILLQTENRYYDNFGRLILDVIIDHVSNQIKTREYTY